MMSSTHECNPRFGRVAYKSVAGHPDGAISQTSCDFFFFFVDPIFLPILNCVLTS